VNWRIVEAVQRMGIVPDIVYDLATVGQEGMGWVLGQNALEVSEKVLRIHARFLGS
jgi:predicted fused transcriptional regulator/phosphomethylpyrimidine kinase